MKDSKNNVLNLKYLINSENKGKKPKSTINLKKLKYVVKPSFWRLFHKSYNTELCKLTDVMIFYLN